jgi:hypothetical protein
MGTTSVIETSGQSRRIHIDEIDVYQHSSAGGQLGPSFVGGASENVPG